MRRGRLRACCVPDKSTHLSLRRKFLHEETRHQFSIYCHGRSQVCIGCAWDTIANPERCYFFICYCWKRTWRPRPEQIDLLLLYITHCLLQDLLHCFLLESLLQSLHLCSDMCRLCYLRCLCCLGSDMCRWWLRGHACHRL